MEKDPRLQISQCYHQSNQIQDGRVRVYQTDPREAGFHHYIRCGRGISSYQSLFRSSTILQFRFPGEIIHVLRPSIRIQNCPYLFNKVLSIAIRSIRERWNIKISNYIDDIVQLNQDKNYLKRTTQEIIAFLQNPSFKIQLKKCRLYPSRVFNYLDWVWNSNSLEVMMTHQRRRLMKMEIKRWINATDNGEMVKVRDLAKLLGELNFLRLQIQDASLISNSLNHLKAQAVKKSGWNCSVLLNRRVLGNLYLWFIKIKQNKPRQLEDLITQAILTTDAALEDWGSTLQIQQTEIMEAGRWQKNQHLKNSNQRGTAVVLMALRMHKQLIEQNQIHSLTHYTDNETVEYNLRRWRAAPNQIHLVRLIFKLLEEMNIQLTTIHIPGLQNNKADALSRLAWRGDYMIKPEILQQTMEQLQFF
ncbi:MAG: hypothetical protein EZS28_047129, partial [Streblomastix strix]